MKLSWKDAGTKMTPVALNTNHYGLLRWSPGDEPDNPSAMSRTLMKVVLCDTGIGKDFLKGLGSTENIPKHMKMEKLHIKGNNHQDEEAADRWENKILPNSPDRRLTPTKKCEN